MLVGDLIYNDNFNLTADYAIYNCAEGKFLVSRKACL